MAFITLEDFKEVVIRIWQRGFYKILKKVGGSKKTRTINTFDHQSQHANWWLLPQIHQYLHNNMQLGNMQHYMQFVTKFVNPPHAVSILSVGCGNGSQELQWAKFWPNASIKAIDITPNNIAIANTNAKQQSLQNIKFIVADWYEIPIETYDIIIFHSSLHHMHQLDEVFNKVKKSLAENGLLVIHDYVGPSKLQFTYNQIAIANKLLKDTPKSYKKLFHTPFYKSKAGIPGLWRMKLNDPSEAIESSNIRAWLLKYCVPLYEKELGGNIFVHYLKDIAHHFTDNSIETKTLLQNVFEEEKVFIDNKQSDFLFGIYQFK